jgi:signal transduction histidine kinase
VTEEKTPRILLVEDEKVDQMAFERTVRQHGLAYDYKIASSAAEAQAILEHETFDLIIMDYLLGDGTGLDVLGAVPKGTPVIFATGAGDEEIAVRAMKAGADDYLIKDLERNYLKVLPLAVEQMLERYAERREVEQLREAMIHTMVHDLRNPLGVIYTSLQLLSMEAATLLPPDYQQVLKIASNNASKMQDLINSILDVSRLESGRMPLTYVPVQIYELVTQTLYEQQPLAEERALYLENDVSPTLPVVQADEGLIKRVLQNLIGNAIKFTPQGGTIRVGAGETEDRMLTVEVSDTGPGISQEIQGRLFQKFVTGKHKARGSGLGLAFCKLVVEAHNGHISVRSEVGQGSTFTFALPIAPDEA